MKKGVERVKEEGKVGWVCENMKKLGLKKCGEVMGEEVMKLGRK